MATTKPHINFLTGGAHLFPERLTQIAFLLLGLRTALLLPSQPGISLIHITVMALAVGLFFLVARRYTTIALLSLFAIFPLVCGLQTTGILPPALNINRLLFWGVFLAWMVKNRQYYDGTASTRLKRTVDWLGLVVIISLVTTLFQYPLALLQQAILHPVIGGQESTFWGLEATAIFLQGLLAFRIYLDECQTRPGINLRKNFFRALILHLFFTAVFYVIQLHWELPPILNGGKSPYAPFDDMHSFGSIILLYIFVIIGYLSCFRKKIPHRLIIFTVAAMLYSLYSTSSTATYLAFFVCGLFYLGLKTDRRIMLVGLGIAIGILVLINLNPGLISRINSPQLRRVALRLNLRRPHHTVTVRMKYADRALGIIASNPVSGCGCGNFWKTCRYYHFFSPTPYHNLRIDNAHNYYLQLAAEAGIPALLLFLLILIQVYGACCKRIYDNNTDAEDRDILTGCLIGISGYLLTMLSGHPLLLVSQQFCFWTVVAHTTCLAGINQPPVLKVRTKQHPRFRKMAPCFFLILLLAGAGFRLHRYPTSPEFGYGAYPVENWNGERVRWIGREFAERFSAKSDILSFVANVHPNNINPDKGLQLIVKVDGHELDNFHFFSPGRYPFYYHLPGITGKTITLSFTLSATFNPYKDGQSNDNRDLGIALEPIIFLRLIPPDNFGFYSDETVSPPPLPEFAGIGSLKGQWTGCRASIVLKKTEKAEGIKLYFFCRHPDLQRKAVSVAIYIGKQIVRRISCKNGDWQTINLFPSQIREQKLLTLSVDRTWNPKVAGISDDTRDLGLFLVTRKVLNK